MSERLSYAKNGIITIDNVSEHIENDDFERIMIGTIGGIDGWYIRMINDTENNQAVIYTLIFNRNKPNLVAKFFTCILTKNGESAFDDRQYEYMNPEERCFGKSISVEMLLDEEKGYLNDDGGLSIEYGIQVESIQGDDGIWKFNFFDTLFDWQNMRNMIRVSKQSGRELKFLHCHKQLLEFHSNRLDPKFNKNNLTKMPLEIDYKTLEQCLQIAHGVRLQLSFFDIVNVIFVAHNFGLQNVVSYCERKLIEAEFKPLSITVCFLFASTFGLNRFLAHLMKNLKSLEELKTILEDEDVPKMSGEAMKKCAKFFFKMKSK